LRHPITGLEVSEETGRRSEPPNRLAQQNEAARQTPQVKRMKE
jgi:hypothetical protein